MVRVLSPMAAVMILLLLTFSAAGASASAGSSIINAGAGSLAAAQPRIEEVTPVAVISVANLPSTSTADPSALMVGLALLAAGGAFILTVRRRTS